MCHYSCQKSVPSLWLNWRWHQLGWAYLQEENRWRNFAGPLEKSGALLSIGIHTPQMNLAGVCGLAWSLPSHSDKKIPIDNLKERRRITLALSFETGGRKKVGYGAPGPPPIFRTTNKWVFNKLTNQGFRYLFLTVSLSSDLRDWRKWRYPSFSIVPEATWGARLRVWDWDKGVAGRK